MKCVTGKILWIEDDPTYEMEDRTTLRDVVSKSVPHEYELLVAETTEDAMEILRGKRRDIDPKDIRIIILDWYLKNRNGATVFGDFVADQIYKENFPQKIVPLSLDNPRLRGNVAPPLAVQTHIEEDVARIMKRLREKDHQERLLSKKEGTPVAALKKSGEFRQEALKEIDRLKYVALGHEENTVKAYIKKHMLRVPRNQARFCNYIRAIIEDFENNKWKAEFDFKEQDLKLEHPKFFPKSGLPLQISIQIGELYEIPIYTIDGKTGAVSVREKATGERRLRKRKFAAVLALALRQPNTGIVLESGLGTKVIQRINELVFKASEGRLPQLLFPSGKAAVKAVIGSAKVVGVERYELEGVRPTGQREFPQPVSHLEYSNLMRRLDELKDLKKDVATLKEQMKGKGHSLGG